MGLLREMQMLMAQQPAAPPSGLTLVNTITLIPTSTGRANYTITLPEAIQAGDQVIVACNYNSTLTSIAFSDTFDNTGATYSTSTANNVAQGLQQCAIKTFTTARAAGSVTVSAIPNANTSGQMVVYHLRGPALSIDSANVQTFYSSAQPGNTAQTFGPYNASAAGFVVALPLIGVNGTTSTMTLGGASTWSTDISGGTTYLCAALHKITSAAISGESFTFTSNKSASTRFTYLYVPFV